MRARRSRSLFAAIALGFGIASPAWSAPLQTNAALSVEIQGLAAFSTSGPGSAIDVTGGQITVPAGLVSLSANMTIPVTATTQVGSLVVTKLSNLAGTFSIGGVTAQAPGEICPTGGPAFGAACNAGGGVGGAMPITGIVFIHILPSIVPIPINLNSIAIGQGGSGADIFSTDAALWTTGVALINTGNAPLTTVGSALGGLTFVTPTFLDILSNQLPVFSTFTLTNYLVSPEPTAPLLLAAGVIGLVLLRRWR